MSGFSRTLAAIAVTATLGLATACSNGGHSGVTPVPQLRYRIIPPPKNYALDKTPGAAGIMTSQLFSEYGGGQSASKAGFVSGYRIGYIDPATNEGISVTVIKFRSPRDATTYMNATVPKTLNLAAATYSPYRSIPGAVAVDGSQEYLGGWQHGVVMTRNKFYALFVYAVAAQSPAPLEFQAWVADEYRLLA